MSCTCSIWLDRNQSAQSLRGGDCLHGTVLDPFWHETCCYPSLTVHEVQISKNMNSEWDGFGPVKPAHMVFSDDESLLTSFCWKLSCNAIRCASAFTMCRTWSYMLFLFRCHHALGELQLAEADASRELQLTEVDTSGEQQLKQTEVGWLVRLDWPQRLVLARDATAKGCAESDLCLQWKDSCHLLCCVNENGSESSTDLCITREL